MLVAERGTLGGRKTGKERNLGARETWERVKSGRVRNMGAGEIWGGVKSGAR